MSSGPARHPHRISALLRARRAGLLALLPLLVWALVWGAWHRTSHGLPGALSTVAGWAAPAGVIGAAVAAPLRLADVSASRSGAPDGTDGSAPSHASHGAGSADCRLIDHLLLADALSAPPAELLLQPESPALPGQTEPATPSAATRWSQQARAPPAA